MAGVWREAGRREEEISWEAEGSSMIAQYDLSMLYAVYMRFGRGQCIFHQWMNKCLPGSEGTLGAWAEVKDAWTEGFLDVLGYGGLKFRKTLTHVSHVPLTSLQKTFTWCFRETVTHLGPCSLVGFFTTERAWYRCNWLLRLGMIGIVHASEFEGLGFLFAQKLRQLKDQILIMKAALFSGAGVGAVVWRDASRRRRRIQLMPIVHGLSLIHFNNLARCGQLGLDGWLAIRFKPNQQRPKVFSTTLDLYSFQAIASIAKESGDTFCSSKVSGTARGGACPGRFHPDGVAQLKTLRVAIECVFKIMGPSVQGRFKDPRPQGLAPGRHTEIPGTPRISLYCWALMMPFGYEAGLLLEQKRQGACRGCWADAEKWFGEILGDFLIFLLQKKVPKMFKQS